MLLYFCFLFFRVLVEDADNQGYQRIATRGSLYALTAVGDRNPYNEFGSLSRAPAGNEKCLALWPNDVEKCDYTSKYYAAKFIGWNQNKSCIRITYDQRSADYNGAVMSVPSYVFCNGGKVPVVARITPLETSFMGRALAATINTMCSRVITERDIGPVYGDIGAEPEEDDANDPNAALPLPSDAERAGKRQGDRKNIDKKGRKHYRVSLKLQVLRWIDGEFGNKKASKVAKAKAAADKFKVYDIPAATVKHWIELGLDHFEEIALQYKKDVAKAHRGRKVLFV